MEERRALGQKGDEKIKVEEGYREGWWILILP